MCSGVWHTVTPEGLTCKVTLGPKAQYFLFLFRQAERILAKVIRHHDNQKEQSIKSGSLTWNLHMEGCNVHVHMEGCHDDRSSVHQKLRL